WFYQSAQTKRPQLPKVTGKIPGFAGAFNIVKQWLSLAYVSSSNMRRGTISNKIVPAKCRRLFLKDQAAGANSPPKKLLKIALFSRQNHKSMLFYHSDAIE